MRTLVHHRVEQARRSENPAVISRVPSGWAVLGDAQYLRGYSLLLPDPVVPDLNTLDLEGRAEFLRDMTLLGDALLEVTGATRINYEIMGNKESALHAHLFPRYATEPEDKRRRPAWLVYDQNSVPFYPEHDRELMRQISARLQQFKHQ